MKFILGKKIGMSQIFDRNGQVVPVTLIEAGPCQVIQIKTKEKDGYQAVQIGFEEIKDKKVKKPQRGHLIKSQKSRQRRGSLASQEFRRSGPEAAKVPPTRRAGASQKFVKYLREFRVEKSALKLGDEIKVGIFQEGEIVKVSGISKGKGFQGVVKRHGFSGFPASHGTKHGLRAPGSIGSAFPERVFKGKKMAGRMGNQRITVQGLKVAQIDKENNLLAIKGAIPGKKGTLLEITATKEIEAVKEEKQEKLMADLKQKEAKAEEKQEAEKGKKEE